MDPQEVVDQLKQAVLTTQANMESFQTACDESADQLSALTSKHEESTQKIIQEAEGLATDTGALAELVASDVIEHTEQSANEVESTIDQYTSVLDNLVHTGVDELTNHFMAGQQLATDFIDTSSAKIAETLSEYEEVGNNHKEILDNTIQKLDVIENSIKQHLTEFMQTFNSNVLEAHLEELNQLQELSDTHINSELVTFFDNTTGEFEDSGDQMVEALGNIGSAVSDKFEELTLEIVEYTGDKATEEMKEKVNGIVDTIVGELASTISESIVKSQVGVSVTTATSPYLPILIAFNKIFDALEGAISAWRKFKDTIGL